MRPVSAEFLDTLTGSHRRVARARLLTTYQTGVNPTGIELDLVGGSVTASASREVRASCDLTVVGRWPVTGTEDLTPYGAEVYVERGLELGGGSTEWVGLGYFRVNSIRATRVWRDGLNLDAIRILGEDRMAGIRDGRYLTPTQYTADQTVGDVMEHAFTEIYPGAVPEWDDATDAETLRRSLIVERDRSPFVRDLAAAYGKAVYFDYRGIPVVRTPPDPSVPVWEIHTGRGGVLIELAREVTRDGVYNGVVASGEGADTTSPVRAIVLDENPASPLRWDGPFGKVPYFFTSPLIITEDQARASAMTILRRVTGRPYAVDLTIVPNVALEPDDPVRVRHSEGYATHVLDDIVYPLDVQDAMTATSQRLFPRFRGAA